MGSKRCPFRSLDWNLMVRSNDGAEKKWYLVSYPDPAAKEVRMEIPTNMLRAAESDSQEAQNSICLLYRQKTGLEVRVWWERLRQNIKTDRDQGDSPPPITVKSPPLGQPSIWGCTCEREAGDCAACTEGNHGSCRYHCKYGQPTK